MQGANPVAVMSYDGPNKLASMLQPDHCEAVIDGIAQNVLDFKQWYPYFPMYEPLSDPMR